MAYDLTGFETDFEATNTRSLFSLKDYNRLFPIIQDSVDPVVSKGTKFATPGVVVKPPSNLDSVYLLRKDSTNIFATKPDKDNGSNNWAVNGKKTKSGAPILSNDPHLGLNLPAIWYEMQIKTSNYNAYGASLPGAPYIIIGFNDSCAFGVTNGGRDVKDFYHVKFKDESRKQYWYNGKWENTTFRYERIAIKNKPAFIDTVAYTVFGPVMYDSKYNGNRVTDGESYAVRWKAHDPSNELRAFNLLNKAQNYKDYHEAISHMQTPGQNFVYASKRGTIALWAQGQFPAKWKRQGDFVMPGTDSTYLWQGNIPQLENPYMVNPERNFVSSANQSPADSTYPYYLGGGFPAYRGLIINRLLNGMNNITVQDMMALQNNNYNIFAEMARPLFLKYVQADKLNPDEARFFKILNEWNLKSDVKETGPTVFELAWKNLENTVWNDEFSRTNLKTVKPYESTLLEGILKDSLYKFADNINTPQKETVSDAFTSSFKDAVVELKGIEAAGKLEWARYKDTRINHLLSIPAFSRMHLPIGGGRHIINATNTGKGPSWKMIVQLSTQTEAYGVYPGGQSGNPGSAFYDNFVDTWSAGRYYPLVVLNEKGEKHQKIKWKMSFE
jgi:penicillin amidase